MACGISVPSPGIEPAPPALEARSLNHWTARELPSRFIGSFFFFFSTIPRAIKMGEHSDLKCAFGKVRLLTSLGLSSPAGEGLQCADPKVTSCVLFLSGPRILVVREGLPPSPLTPNRPSQHAETSRMLLLDLLRGSSTSQLKPPLVRGSRHLQIGKSCPWLRVGPTRGSWEE